MSKAKHPISEHALFRYIERVVGVDMEALAKHICTPGVVAMIDAGVSKVTLGDGSVAIVENGMIVTVLTAEQAKAAKLKKFAKLSGDWKHVKRAYGGVAP